MRKTISVFIVLALTASMLFSVCGCNSKQKSAEALSFCTAFCEDVKSGDAGRLITYFNDNEITEGELKEIITPSGSNSEEKEVLASIKETTDYKVQEPVYDPKAKTATAYVSWEQADYNSDQVTSSASLSGLKTAVKSAPLNIITVCVTVDLSGDIPKIINPKEVIDAVYAFNTADLGIMPGLVSDYYTSGDWVLAPKGVYTNTKEIGVRLDFKKEMTKYKYVPGYIYTVAKGDKVLLTSEINRFENNSIRLDFTADMAGPEVLNEDGFLKADTYTVTVFDEHSNDIASFKCEVKNEEVEKEEIELEEYSDDHYLSELVYEFKDSDLMGKTFVYNSGWWDYDDTSIGKSAFGSDTTVLGFSLAVSEDNDVELYYEYYYSEEADFEDISGSEPVYQRSCKPSMYQDLVCYDFDYSSGDIEPGYYALVVYGDAAKKHIVFTAACMVVEETSADIT